MSSGASWVARFALPILVAGVAAISLSPILVRLAEVGPIAAAVNRMALPLPLFFLVLWMRPQDRIPMNTATGKRALWAVVLSGVFFAGDLSFWHTSITMTSVANATVLSNLAPVFVVLGARLLFNERFSTLFIVGLALSVAGVGVLVAESATVSAETFKGDLLAVITSVFYGAYLLAISRARRTVSTVATMAIGGAVATAVLWIVALVLEGNVWPATLNGWLVALALAVVVQIGGQTLIALSLAHVPAGFGSMILLLQPILAALVAWVLFSETLSLWQVVGAAAILGGLELARRGTPPKP